MYKLERVGHAIYICVCIGRGIFWGRELNSSEISYPAKKKNHNLPFYCSSKVCVNIIDNKAITIISLCLQKVVDVICHCCQEVGDHNSYPLHFFSDLDPLKWNSVYTYQCKIKFVEGKLQNWWGYLHWSDQITGNKAMTKVPYLKRWCMKQLAWERTKIKLPLYNLKKLKYLILLLS